MAAMHFMVAALAFMTACAEAKNSPWKEDALRFLNNRTFQCVHVGLPGGSGFFRPRPWNTALERRLYDLPDYAEVPLNITDVTGMSVDTLLALQSNAEASGSHFDIQVFYYKVPGWNDQQELESVLSRYDCILSSIFITSDRVTAMDFQLPHVPFGFQVMTSVPAVAQPRVVDRIVACLQPFSMEVWLTILGLVALSSILIGLFEGSWGMNNDFHWWQWRRAKMLRAQSHEPETSGAQVLGADVAGQDLRGPPAGQSRVSRILDQCDRFGYSAFRAVTALTTGDNVNPHTAAGRLYNAGLSIVFVILIASYTANLAAQLTVAGIPVQSIQSVNDFMSQGQVCCVRNSSVHIEYVRTNYPRMKTHIVKDASERLLAEAIDQGLCAGAISTNVHLRYFLATDQDYACKMTVTGDVLNFGYYAIPWSRQLSSDSNHSVADAMSMLMGELLDSGYLNDLMQLHFPHTASIQCDTPSSLSAGSLEILDLSGIFIIQAIIALCSIVLFVSLKFKSQRVRTKAAKVVSNVQRPLSSTLRGTWSRSRKLSGGLLSLRITTGRRESKAGKAPAPAAAVATAAAAVSHGGAPRPPPGVSLTLSAVSAEVSKSSTPKSLSPVVEHLIDESSPSEQGVRALPRLRSGKS